MLHLRHSTASQVIILGPFVDDTDFKTAKTGLTIANTDIKLLKHGSTSTANKNSGGATHITSGSGNYHTTLDATDTDTVGRLRVYVAVAGALQVWADFEVLPAHVYDSLHANANGPSPVFGIIDAGTAQGVTGTTIQLRAAAAFANDEIIGATVIITGGSAGVGQARIITDYVSSTDTATVDTWTTTPTGTITYVVIASPPGSTSVPAAANVTQWNGTAVATPDTAGFPKVTIKDGTGTGELDTASGKVALADGSISAATFAAGAIDAAAIATDAIGSNELAASAVSKILTTQMTEAYAADGVAPTLAQALFMIQQLLGEFGVVGTTLTVKKIDGSTNAATFTLNSSTNPTSITRST